MIELLVVITTIELLMALLLPAIQRVRETMNRVCGRSNLHPTCIALMNDHNDIGRLSPGYLYAYSLRGNVLGHGWVDQLMPYVEQYPLHRQIHWESLIRDASNITARTQHLRIDLR